mmetsp:Transcript_8774/g.21210  ORF Transcript_8774/g.21210 Transcript_8774/m.21210 type:complete len:596 (-) Transcript_8774:70-1857(-)
MAREFTTTLLCFLVSLFWVSFQQICSGRKLSNQEIIDIEKVRTTDVVFTVKLQGAPPGGLQAHEGLSLSAWVYDPWSIASPECLARKPVFYSPALVNGSGASVTLELGEPSTKLEPGLRRGQLLYYVRVEGLKRCCRFAYSVGYVTFDPSRKLSVELAPALSRTACDSNTACAPEGWHLVRLSLAVSSVPSVTWFDGQSVVLSVWSYLTESFSGGSLERQFLVGEQRVTPSHLSVDRPVDIDIPVELPKELMQHSLQEISSYAAITTDGSINFTYHGFQPLPVLSQSWDGGQRTQIMGYLQSTGPADIAQAGGVHASGDLPGLDSSGTFLLTDVYLSLDSEPPGGFGPEEGVVFRLEARVGTERSPIGEWTLRGVDARRAAASRVRVNASVPLGTDGVSVHVEPLGGCCRYGVEPKSPPSASPGGRGPVEIAGRLSKPRPGCAAVLCTARRWVPPELARVTLELGGVPEPPPGDEEGVLARVWVQESAADPLAGNFREAQYRVGERFVRLGGAGASVAADIPLDFSSVPAPLRTGGASMWATAGTAGCCRFEFYVLGGMAHLDAAAPLPSARLSLRLSRSPPCNASQPCTAGSDR